MGWESFGVVGFDLGPLLQGQMKIAKLKVLITCVFLVLEVWDGKPTYRKSWAGNLLMWSDLTFGPLLQGQMRIFFKTHFSHRKNPSKVVYYIDNSKPLLTISYLDVFMTVQFSK